MLKRGFMVDRYFTLAVPWKHFADDRVNDVEFRPLLYPPEAQH